MSLQLNSSNSKRKNKFKMKNICVSGQLNKQIHRRRLSLNKANASKRGVVLIKNLPYGFFEEQLEKYFSQFGRVTRLRLCRSRTTGTSKGFAFIEFEYPEVAQIAAETMNNYLMFQKIVKTVYIPPEKQCYNYFKTSIRHVTNKYGKQLWVSSKTSSIHRKMQAYNNWSEVNLARRNRQQLAKFRKIHSRLTNLGLNLPNVLVRPESKGEDFQQEMDDE